MPKMPAIFLLEAAGLTDGDGRLKTGGRVPHEKTQPLSGVGYIYKVYKLFLHGSQLHLLLELHHILAEKAVGIHQILYRLAGMDDSSMIPPAKVLADGL